MSEQPIHGGPAFPSNPTTIPGHYSVGHSGMTLRDWFAGQALSGIIKWKLDFIKAELELDSGKKQIAVPDLPTLRGNGFSIQDFEDISLSAYSLAELMLEVRKIDLWEDDKEEGLK